jgi:hypothetical protein
MSAYSPPTRTVGEVIKDVTRKFGDEAGIELENADIVRWINDAMDTIVARNNVLKARAKINTEGGKNDRGEAVLHRRLRGRSGRPRALVRLGRRAVPLAGPSG